MQGMSDSTITDSFFRRNYGPLIARLANQFGTECLDDIEDAVQEAFEKAIKKWSYESLPDYPEAWLYRVAFNQMIDLFRRSKKISDSSVELSANEQFVEDPDDMLRMMFRCCHPGLSQESQIILVLKALMGFSNRDVARLLLKKEDTVAKNYTRAKAKFRVLAEGLRIPTANTLKARVSVVQRILYVLFTEGYKPTEGDAGIRRDLCDDAIHYALMLETFEEGSTHSTFALLALMLFHRARFSSRLDTSGIPVTLEDQDRSTWDQRMIKRATSYLKKAFTDVGRPSPYHFQAAMAALHAKTPAYQETNWQELLELYDLELKYYPSEITRLNRLVVLSRVAGPEAALVQLDGLRSSSNLTRTTLFWTVEADIRFQLKQTELAKAAYGRAGFYSKNEAERRWLEKKLEELD